jgi:hypothetical protein
MGESMKKAIIRIEYRDEEDRITFIKTETYETKKFLIDILAALDYIKATLTGN